MWHQIFRYMGSSSYTWFYYLDRLTVYLIRVSIFYFRPYWSKIPKKKSDVVCECALTWWNFEGKVQLGGDLRSKINSILVPLMTYCQISSESTIFEQFCLLKSKTRQIEKRIELLIFTPIWHLSSKQNHCTAPNLISGSFKFKLKRSWN